MLSLAERARVRAHVLGNLEAALYSIYLLY
jgi:hypothetical protein